jgi:hypothetical protein
MAWAVFFLIYFPPQAAHPIEMIHAMGDPCPEAPTRSCIYGCKPAGNTLEVGAGGDE